MGYRRPAGGGDKESKHWKLLEMFECGALELLVGEVISRLETVS